MRRKDREITELSSMIEIMKKCDVCNLAFYDQEFPYLIPMNFGMAVEDGKISLYFHCADAGKKLELLKINNKIAFAMSCEHKLIENRTACEVTMEYESVCGNGILEIVPEEDKIEALCHFMQQYTKQDEFVFHEVIVKKITILKLTVNEISGKALKKKHSME